MVRLKRILSVIFLLPAWFSPHAKLRTFFHKLRGVKIGKKVEIGYYVILDMEYPDLITIKDHATVVANSVILSHDHSKKRTGRGDSVIKKTVIEKHAFIGVGAIILPGITIGKYSIVGAGAVVTKDVPDHCVAVGNPAQIIQK